MQRRSPISPCKSDPGLGPGVHWGRSRSSRCPITVTRPCPPRLRRSNSRRPTHINSSTAQPRATQSPHSPASSTSAPIQNPPTSRRRRARRAREPYLPRQPHGAGRRGEPEARGGRLPRRWRPLRPAAPDEARPLLGVRGRRRPQLPAGVRPGRSAPAYLPRRRSAGAPT